VTNLKEKDHFLLDMERGKSFCSTTTFTKEMKGVIYSLSWEVLPHATYSLDLAPSDYHLFRSLQHHFTDMYFKTLKEVRKSINDFIASKLFRGLKGM
jgi:hypothetical protein